MIALIKLAFRNCLRNKKRSILTLLSISIGIMAMLISSTVINGLDETTKRNFFNTNVSALKIFNKLYFPQRNDQLLENFIDKPAEIKTALIKRLPNLKITERIKFRGRIITGINELPATIIGVDLTDDSRVFTLLSSITAKEKAEKLAIINSLQTEPDTCLIGSALRKALDVNIGDEIEVYVRTVHNAHNAVSYRIIGDLYTENPEIDSYSLVIKKEDAALLADCDTMVSEIDVAYSHYDKKNLNQIKNAINAVLPVSAAVFTWEEELSDMLTFFALRKVGQSLIITFLLLLAIAGVTNTMLMAVFERTKEIGTISALGMKRRKIIALFVAEGAILGIIGGVIAIAITSIPITLLCRFGFTIPNADLAQNITSKIYGYIYWWYYPVAVILAVLTASLATLYPSIKAVHLNVAQILRGK